MSSTTLKASQENDIEICQWSHCTVWIEKNIGTPQSYQEMDLIPEG